jgi:hypothetical protein
MPQHSSPAEGARTCVSRRPEKDRYGDSVSPPRRALPTRASHLRRSPCGTVLHAWPDRLRSFHPLGRRVREHGCVALRVFPEPFDRGDSAPFNPWFSLGWAIASPPSTHASPLPRHGAASRGCKHDSFQGSGPHHRNGSQRVGQREHAALSESLSPCSARPVIARPRSVWAGPGVHAEPLRGGGLQGLLR